MLLRRSARARRSSLWGQKSSASSLLECLPPRRPGSTTARAPSLFRTEAPAPQVCLGGPSSLMLSGFSSDTFVVLPVPSVSQIPRLKRPHHKRIPRQATNRSTRRPADRAHRHTVSEITKAVEVLGRPFPSEDSALGHSIGCLRGIAAASRARNI